MKLKYGFEQAKSMQDLQIMSFIASGIFGGEKPKPAQNHQEAQAQLANVFGKGI